MKKLSVIIIGAGDRGTSYSKLMAKMPDHYQVVGVADPVATRRKSVQERHGIADSGCFVDWKDILNQPKMADVAVIASMDDQHYETALRAIDLGYHLLLEKPVAPTAQACVDIAKAAEKKGVSVLVCHVLRYTPFFKKVKQLLLEGAIGNVMSMIQVEAVGNLHQSHSFVRGNWHSSKETAPMLLAKSCHDIDMIQWLMNKPCKRVQSFGDLTYFCPANAPEGAPVRCADGTCPVKDTCEYNCIKLYYDNKESLWFRGAATRGMTAGEIPTDDEVMEALKTRDYGLCVFHANNDVVDHQVVNLEFEGGANVSFTMNCFNEGGRYIRIFGTKGELYANAGDEEITVFSFADRQKKTVSVPKIEESILGGHGGGDAGIICELYEYLSGNYTGYCAADITTSVNNHMIVFAAEKARHEGSVVSIDEFMSQYGILNQYPNNAGGTK